MLASPVGGSLPDSVVLSFPGAALRSCLGGVVGLRGMAADVASSAGVAVAGLDLAVTGRRSYTGDAHTPIASGRPS